MTNISSVHGLRASPFKAGYISAKHGLEGLSKVVAPEGGPHGVASNTICLAYVRTTLVEGQIADQSRAWGIPENEVIEKVMLTGPAIKNASSSPRRWPRWPHFSAPRRRRSSTALP